MALVTHVIFLSEGTRLLRVRTKYGVGHGPPHGVSHGVEVVNFPKKKETGNFNNFLIIFMLPIILDYCALVVNNVFRIVKLSAHHPRGGW